MEYRVLGRTGIKVSAIGLGGEGFENKNYEQCEAIVDCAIKEGINLIDIYNSNPEVRSNVGRALSKYERSSFVVEGHLCSTWDKGQYRRTRDINEVVSAFEDFLTRMKLDYVDLGMLHYVDNDKDYDSIFQGDILKYAKELKEKGVIKVLGLSTHNTDIALRAVESGIIDVILFSINAAYDMLPATDDIYELFEDNTYIDRVYQGVDPKRDKLYRSCENAGVALTVMKGYAAGVLFNDKRSPFGRALTPVQCIYYCLTRPAVASVIVGVANPAEVLAATAYTLSSDKDKDYSEVLANAPKSSFSGICMYCGHCAPCSSKIDIASVNKYLDLALIQEGVPETLKDHYHQLEYRAEECIECGQCMENCPFGVDVIMKRSRQWSCLGSSN